MIADFAVHQPDKKDGGIPNPHFHILCPIRPVEENGKWGSKQRGVYRLYEDGTRIMDKNGRSLFDAVPAERQGLNELPAVHEGAAVRQMEIKSKTTDKGDLNRWIRATNNLLRDIRKKIAALTDWLKVAKAQLSKPKS